MFFTVMSKLLNLKHLTLNNSTKCSSTLKKQNSITNSFKANVSFPYSTKTSETCDFLMFSGGIEMEHWLEVT